ncbi:MAG: CCA tRNA nucleotidyltransferase [Parachlamydiaceae bacterium]|nr:CCA tRNA nucleotidyltransferase [Parachlamydiaceae bacterium]
MATNVQESAVAVIKTLVRAGYIAYFAGGWVRDYIMKHSSDDIDIATNAPPEVVLSLFPKTIPVGVAFGVVIVMMNGHQFEVATFREDLSYTGGRRPDKIVLSTPEADAMRRDFTINGMFYDPLKDEILDFVEGQQDIERGIIRTIGNAHERFAEDRLRMIRAIRFANRFGFSVTEETREAIEKHAHTLFPAVAIERVWQELSKMAKFSSFGQALLDMHAVGLLPVIFPALSYVDSSILQQRVAHFHQIPQNAPPILFLMDLFPEMSLEELLTICQYLKISTQEGKLVEYLIRGKALLEKGEMSPSAIEKLEWANFYAHQFFDTCFDVITAKYPESERSVIVDQHDRRREHLLPHIQRIMEKKPLVTAALLQDYGIVPGKLMGALLREAERLAVAHDLHDPAEVVVYLKETEIWPKQ